MCIEVYATCKPLLEQMLLEFINCQVYHALGDVINLHTHYRQLLDIEQKCQEISGINYEYHSLLTL